MTDTGFKIYLGESELWTSKWETTDNFLFRRELERGMWFHFLRVNLPDFHAF